MNTTLSPETTVATIASEIPGAAGVFERIGIDYCCGGKVRLAQACGKRGLKVDDVLSQLQSTAAGTTPTVRNWSQASMTELADEIEAKHHGYLKSELPRLCALADKVDKTHGDHRPELHELAHLFRNFADDMTIHMGKEEQVLFPILRSMDKGQSSSSLPINFPITCMTQDHEEAGAALELFRALTNGYTPPADACTSWRVLLADLARLECDMHEHVHKENNILFPKALAAAGGTR